MSGHTRLADLPCPYCSEVLGCADAVKSGTSPKDGDVSICGECIQPSIFVAGPLGLAFRKPTQDESISIMAVIGPTLQTYRASRGR